MRVVALEEHFLIPELAARIDPELVAKRGWPRPGTSQASAGPQAKLIDMGPNRLADMDASGIDIQVLSLSGPGADLVEPEQAVPLARAFNDGLGAIIQGNPSRYAGFAHLPLTAPHAAAEELERTVAEFGFKGALVNGLTGGRFLDDPVFEPLLLKAVELGVPIYLHPNHPPEEVRRAYYGNLPEGLGTMLSIAGWGWHSEVAVHVLRLVLSGALDRHPSLKLIVGHMGEGLPAMMTRFDDVFTPFVKDRLTRSVSSTIRDQVWITTSGIFSTAPFLSALLTFGVDRILFSVDYPYCENRVGRKFLDTLPVSVTDKLKIAHGNADALLRLKTIE